MRWNSLLLAMVVIATLGLAATSGASTPPMINFQGLLRDGVGAPVADGPHSTTFTFYNAPVGGTVLWTETQSVTTTGGLFNVLLGATVPISVSVFGDTACWLGMIVEPDLAELTPRRKIVSVGYSQRVASVDGAEGGTINGKVSIGPGHTNTGAFAFVAGRNNMAFGDTSVIAGGHMNTTLGTNSAILGGYSNEASAWLSTVGGGYDNTAGGVGSTVTGGSYNRAAGVNSMVGGGVYDTASGDQSTVVGGMRNRATAQGGAVVGGLENLAAGGFNTFVGGGLQNRTLGAEASVVGGQGNVASGDQSIVAGGVGNLAAGLNSGVGSGRLDSALGSYSVVSGGFHNVALGALAVISGGSDNIANVDAATVGGGTNDTASGLWSTVSGGSSNSASGRYSIVGGGRSNRVTDTAATVGGGESNTAGDNYATVAGGFKNLAARYGSTVSGGTNNVAGAEWAVVGGGGGSGLNDSNRALGQWSVIPGGRGNLADAHYSFAAGRRARAIHPGAFVWADSTNADFSSTAAGQFLVRATAIGLGTNSPASKLDVEGSVAIGATYSGTSAAPANGLIVEGSVGMGTNAPANKLDVEGSAVIGATYSGTNAAPANGLLVQGMVGINTTTTAAQLDVKRNGNVVALFDRTGTDGTVVNIGQDGTAEGSISVAVNTVSYNAFTGSHYGWTDESLDHGMLVSLTGENGFLHGDPQSEAIYGIRAATKANDPACLGSYLSRLESGQPAGPENPHLVMAVGNGVMWVTETEGGIEPGDYLIASDVPGHAMKDDAERFEVGHIVARAAERVNWSTVTAEVNGRKHKLVSVLFGNFVRSNSTRLEETIRQLEERLQHLEAGSARAELR